MDAAADPPEFRSLGLVKAVSDAYLGSDWAAMRALYHDDALLSTLAAQQEIVPPDELVRIFAHVTSQTVYAVDDTETVAIDDDAVLVTGQIRFPLASGGFGEGKRAWILTFKDGLLYRTCAYTTAAKARTAYAQYGIDLGIEAPMPAEPAQRVAETEASSAGRAV